MRKLLSILFILLFCSSLLQATVYDNDYKIVHDGNTTVDSNETEYNPYMYGHFNEIIRFDMLSYIDYELDDGSVEIFDTIVQKIKELEQANLSFSVTIIGYTSKTTDDISEENIDSDTYANAIQNIFRYSLDTNESNTLSENFALDVQNKLVDNNIDKNLTIVEYRGGREPAFSQETSTGRDLSNRVMVSIYVTKNRIIDSDKDGVIDGKDFCPNTPEGVKVDVYGCALDTDKDKVPDFKDKCPNTPLGVEVDKTGCPLDSDKDLVENYKDRCPRTKQGLKVDEFGCPQEMILNINFPPKESKIPASFYPEVQKYAKFLKLYPAYYVDIIGHTDSVGKTGVNMKLSQDRAASFKNALIAEGVSADRVRSSGRGEYEPLKSNRTSKGRKANRRIEVKLSY